MSSTELMWALRPKQTEGSEGDSPSAESARAPSAPVPVPLSTVEIAAVAMPAPGSAPMTTVEIAAVAMPPPQAKAVQRAPLPSPVAVDVADMHTVELPMVKQPHTIAQQSAVRAAVREMRAAVQSIGEQREAKEVGAAVHVRVTAAKARRRDTASEGESRAIAALASGQFAALASTPKPKESASETSTTMLVAIGTQRDPTDAKKRLVVMAPHEKDRQAIVEGWWVLEGDGIATRLVSASGASAARIEARTIVGDKSFTLRAAREQDLATLAVL